MRGFFVTDVLTVTLLVYDVSNSYSQSSEFGTVPYHIAVNQHLFIRNCEVLVETVSLVSSVCIVTSVWQDHVNLTGTVRIREIAIVQYTTQC